MNDDGRSLRRLKRWQPRFVGIPVRYIELALLFVFVLWQPIPAEDSPNPIALKAMQAEAIVNQWREALSLTTPVQIAVVIYHPLVFAVEPASSARDRFRLSMELGFLEELDDDDLHAALAHEIGHVWIFNHHPFLQTERLANEVGLRLVKRDSLERLYRKLWKYEDTAGVAMEQLLGPSAQNDSRPVPQP